MKSFMKKTGYNINLLYQLLKIRKAIKKKLFFFYLYYANIALFHGIKT